jgi:hypothetical protein
VGKAEGGLHQARLTIPLGQSITQETLMKSGTSNTRSRLAALLLGAAMSSAYAVDPKEMTESGPSFKDHDSNKDGYLSLDEFKAKGKDDLAFKAADVDGDERLDRSEFDRYLVRKANDQSKPARPPAGN